MKTLFNILSINIESQMPNSVLEDGEIDSSGEINEKKTTSVNNELPQLETDNLELIIDAELIKNQFSNLKPSSNPKVENSEEEGWEPVIQKASNETVKSLECESAAGLTSNQRGMNAETKIGITQLSLNENSDENILEEWRKTKKRKSGNKENLNETSSSASETDDSIKKRHWK